MERAKKMVLISTDNLERLQRHQQQLLHTSSTSASSAPSTMPSSSVSSENEATEDKESSVRTPGTALTRLDAEMHRILNGTILGGAREKWQLYREVLQRYLHFFREREKRRLLRKNAADGIAHVGNEGTLAPDDPEDMELGSIGESTRSTRSSMPEQDLPELEIDQVLRPRSIVSPRERREVVTGSPRRCYNDRKSVGRLLNKLPKTYRNKTRKLLAHLCAVAVPGKISWDRQGVVTIGGRVLSGSNIVDLLNDAARERKSVRAVARAQFAHLLRAVDTPPEFVGNRDFLEIDAGEAGLASPLAASSPVPSRGNRPARKRGIDETSFAETDADHALYVAPSRGTDKIRVSAAKPALKRRLLDWNLLGWSAENSPRESTTSRGIQCLRAKKRAVEDTRKNVPATFITSDRYKHKTRVSGAKTASKRRLIGWNKLQ